MVFLQTKNGHLDTDRKFNQILTSAEELALQSTNSKNESNKSPSEFLASYQSTGLESYDLKNKTVIIRADLNVPIKDGKVKDNSRILASVKTIKYAQIMVQKQQFYLIQEELKLKQTRLKQV